MSNSEHDRYLEQQDELRLEDALLQKDEQDELRREDELQQEIQAEQLKRAQQEDSQPINLVQIIKQVVGLK
tara:strand:+ start:997 stop:1209 length:213 start_codon:yes stop_codon:yes gene_type:complete